jgi:VWFA-related protein
VKAELSVMRFFLVLTTATVCLAAQQQQPPTFKSGIEIFHLDVSVLDRNRKPVRGLTAADFTVLEDGQPQKIAAFSAVEVPAALAPPAPWMHEVTPDVASNQFREQRLVLVVMDDATLPFDPRGMKNAREIGHSIVDALGPADLAAVVFTRDNRRPQDFTADRARLHAAIYRTTPSNLRTFQFDLTSMTYYVSSIETLWAASRLLIDIPQRRKALVYVSGGVPVNFEEASTPVLAGPGVTLAGAEAQRRLVERMRAIFAEAARANVNVYTFDVCGLRAPGNPLRPLPCDQANLNVEFLQTVAANTGGRAVVHTSDFRPGVVRVFEENAAYYLLGYESGAMKGAGHYRRVEVKVDRPGVEVRSRTRHYADAPPDAKRAEPLPEVTKALAGLLPKNDIDLAVQAAPIAIAGRRDLTAMAVTLSFRQPREALAGATAAELDWEVRAFDPEGRPRGVQQQRAKLALGAVGGDVRLELLTRLDLKPGTYQLRLAAHDAAQARSGSVYVDVDVPDFGKAAVSMSGVLLSSPGGPPAAPKDAFATLVPVVPTAIRSFSTLDRVAGFVRVYQSGDVKKPAAAVPLTIRLTGTDDTPLVNSKQTLEPERFTARAADVRFDLPVASLKPGPYLLTLEATLGKTTARRDVRFEIR